MSGVRFAASWMTVFYAGGPFRRRPRPEGCLHLEICAALTHAAPSRGSTPTLREKAPAL
jgi:hypothetical protein